MRYRKLIACMLSILVALSGSVFSAGAISKEDMSINTATRLQRCLAEVDDFRADDVKDFDFNKNDEVDILDVTYFQRVLAEIYTLPATPDEATKDEPVKEPTTEPITQILTEPVTKPLAEPITAPDTEPTTEPVTQITTEPITAPATTQPMPTQLLLNCGAITLGVGEEYTFSITCDVENPELVYSTLNPAVATVENGTLKAVGAGSTIVTCQTVNGIIDICNVTIKPMATSVSIPRAVTEIGIGESLNLKASLPNGTAAYYIEYTSSNSKAVTVDTNGMAKGIAEGIATVFCRLSNGVQTYCNITVRKAPTASSVSLPSSKTLKVGNKISLKPTLNGCASDKLTYSLSDKNVAEVDSNGNLLAKKLGKTVLTVTTYNNIKKTCTITVNGSAVKCLDISYAQGNVDFKKVKAAGYDYVILRAGYGWEANQEDSYFSANYRNAKAAGLKIGLYWYGYATNAYEAMKEAEYCLSIVKRVCGKDTLDMPIYYDLEEYSQAVLYSRLYNVADAFCWTIENAGYQAGIYTGYSMMTNMDYKSLAKDYSLWLAYLDSDVPDISVDVHQYSWVTRVNGISTDVDCSFIYNLNIVSK